MKIIHLVPGAGNLFYCENCLRDRGRIKAMRKMEHDAIVVPLYLPLLTDEAYCKPDTPVFYGGINVYLQQKSSVFRKTPRWIDRFFDSSIFLKWAAGMSGMTKAEELGEMTLSMLRGKDGNQSKELERLVEWLCLTDPPDVIHLSNALLTGMARRIKQELHVPIVCSLQDEDIWVDALPEPQRSAVWETLAERANDVDAFISVSKYYKDFMRDRLKVSDDRIHVVYNGIDLEGHEQTDLPTNPPVIGYLERQCREKGLAVLVEAFAILRKSGKVPDVKLRIAGGKIPEDELLIKEMRQLLAQQNLSDDVEFLPNLSREDKLAFLRDISILSVPAEHREAFGMYMIEALASGVPVVQPRHGAFIELLDATGGGILCDPDDPQALADAMETLLLDPERARALGKQGRKAVFESFSAERMARDMIKVLESVTK